MRPAIKCSFSKVSDRRRKRQAGESKGGHELTLNQDSAKPRSFDKTAYESGDLYRWSSLRSAYLAKQTSISRTLRCRRRLRLRMYGAGWYWDPWFGSYTFIPGDGIFYSPFGWGSIRRFGRSTPRSSSATGTSITTSTLTAEAGIMTDTTLRACVAVDITPDTDTRAARRKQWRQSRWRRSRRRRLPRRRRLHSGGMSGGGFRGGGGGFAGHGH